MALTRPRAAQIYDIDYKQATRVVTVANITLGGGAPSSVDGVSLSLNDRVLVTGQSTASQNGIYYVTTVGTGSNGTWARSTDTNSTGELLSGTIVMVTEGLIYADTQWKLTTNDPITIGSTALTFVQNYSANSISAGTSNVSVLSNSSVTISSAGTANVAKFDSTAVTFTANLLPTSNVTYSLGTTSQRWKDIWLSNSTIYLGAVSLSADATQLTVNGSNVVTASAGGVISTAGNVTGGNILTTGNIYTGNILTNGYYYANGVAFAGGGSGGTPTGANTYVQFNDNGIFGGTAGFTFNKTTNAIVTTGTVSAIGNITGGNISTVGIQTAASTVGGVITGSSASVTGAVTGASLVGTITTASQTNITSVGTLGSLTVTANIQGGNLRTSGLVSATGSITGASVVGGVMTGSSLSVTGTINGTTLTGTSLTVSTGNITGGNLLLSGAIQDSGQLDIQTTASNGNIVLTPNGTGNVNTSANISAAGRVTAASTVGGVITGTSTSVTGSQTAASTVGGVITGSSASVTGAVTGASLVGTITTASQTNITSVGTLGSLSVTANVQGGNLRTAGLVSATGSITGASVVGGVITGSSASLTGNVTGGNIITSGSGGNITGANVISATTITTSQITNSGANGVGNIGSSTTYFNTVFAKATSAQYADLAEMYSADENYMPSTVVEFGGTQEITISTQSHSPAVAGIISTNPSYLMNSALDCKHPVEVALTGRVPCQVVGVIRKGDRLVASQLPGVATVLDMKYYEPGCIIGKALEDYDSIATGIIEVAVGRF